MKKLFVVLLWCVVCSKAFAFEGAGFPYAFSPPYPHVLSPAIDILPEGFDTIIVGDETFYYCNGIFYQKIVIDDKYTIVPPPIGAVVFDLPPGYQYMLIHGEAYYVSGGVYYKRVLEGFKVVYPPVVL